MTTATTATGKVYYTFNESSGSLYHASLAALIKHANNVMDKATWIDVQGESDEQKRLLLSELVLGLPASSPSSLAGGHKGSAIAGLPPAVLEELVTPSENDVVQLQPLKANYVQGVLSCASGSVMFDLNNNFNSCAQQNSMATVIEDGGEGEENAAAPPPPFSAEAIDAENGMVWCAFLATEKVLLSLHDRPFVGLAEMVRDVEMRFQPGRGYNSPASPNTASAVDDAWRRFSTGFALATLVTFTSETMLPDPTALLSEVDCIDEMVLLIAPGTRDQPDLLRRVALLRRRISAFRARLYLKEKLLQELVTPAMRGSFVSRDASAGFNGGVGMGGGVTMLLYKESTDKIAQVADRLDDARDILNQANLNFVTGVSMRMSQSSANMDFKMQILGQVATICLPLNLIASIFGMNCTVPWQSDTHPTLHAFFGIVGLMLAWCLLCSVPTIRDWVRGNPAKAIVPTE